MSLHRPLLRLADENLCPIKRGTLSCGVSPDIIQTAHQSFHIFEPFERMERSVSSLIYAESIAIISPL